LAIKDCFAFFGSARNDDIYYFMEKVLAGFAGQHLLYYQIFVIANEFEKRKLMKLSLSFRCEASPPEWRSRAGNITKFTGHQ
jgi:hypothetical protein